MICQCRESIHINHLKHATLVAALPIAWHYEVGTGTGRASVMVSR